MPFQETFISELFIDFSATSKVFELLTSALAHRKCQVILYITAKEEMRLWQFCKAQLLLSPYNHNNHNILDDFNHT